MALKNIYRRSVASDGKLEMSLQEFKKWLKRFDTNNDGKISKELQEAVRANGGGWFSRLKGSRGIKVADANGDGYIDENEFNNLVEFAQRNLGVRIVSYVKIKKQPLYPHFSLSSLLLPPFCSQYRCRSSGERAPVTAPSSSPLLPAKARRNIVGIFLVPGILIEEELQVMGNLKLVCKNKQIDTNNDGKISKKEFQEAVRANGGCKVQRLKGRRGIKAADTNGDGYIDENEFNNLVEFAQRNLGVRIVSNY
ncbi:uncharacterized protein LOC132039325 [Lycium ferocissimum]|uniref:uncharacterized protein LOC132039325 n=1 Tax=Lycium ferocissimum TaxID=112874 RepID=UPI0028163F79|nr:uncharacterized protein LOC132039325 [Lycium ferocissimum]